VPNEREVEYPHFSKVNLKKPTSNFMDAIIAIKDSKIICQTQNRLASSIFFAIQSIIIFSFFSFLVLV
jgi:hypothetical protein